MWYLVQHGRAGDEPAFWLTEFAAPHVFVVDIWADDGDPRWRVPRGEVDAAVDYAFNRWDVVELACDPWGSAAKIEAWAKRHGECRLFECNTGAAARMGPATGRLYQAVTAGTVSHDGDRRLAFPHGQHGRQEHRARRPGDQGPPQLTAQDRRRSRCDHGPSTGLQPLSVPRSGTTPPLGSDARRAVLDVRAPHGRREGTCTRPVHALWLLLRPLQRDHPGAVAHLPGARRAAGVVPTLRGAEVTWPLSTTHGV